MDRRSNRRWQLVLLILLGLVVVGCSGRGNVSGKITYQNKPLVFGTILIQGSDGKAAQGNIAKDGSFTVRGLATGSAKVAVNSPNPRSITLIPNKNPNYPQEPYPDAPGWFAIPNQYESVSTSPLTITVRGGNNTVVIELK
jgi:hypothetical protein